MVIAYQHDKKAQLKACDHIHLSTGQHLKNYNNASPNVILFKHIRGMGAG